MGIIFIMDALEKVYIPGQMEHNCANLHHIIQNSIQCKTHDLFVCELSLNVLGYSLLWQKKSTENGRVLTVNWNEHYNCSDKTEKKPNLFLDHKLHKTRSLW